MSPFTRSLHLISLLYLAYFANVALSQGNYSDCATALTDVLGYRVSYPNNTAYTDSLSGYSSIFNSELSPTIIVKPVSAEEVATVIKTVAPYNGTKGCQIAIRGEGQQSTPGASNIAGGITLDLSSLALITIYKDNNSVSIGAGARWGDVYYVLTSQGLAVNGGRPSLGGIGGLALAGGLSFFSSRKGFISDNVLNFQVVLANGQIVDANAQSNRDLWLALRGGSNNFGVVTRFDMATFAQGPFWGGNVSYAASAVPTQLKSLVNYYNGEEFDGAAYVQVGLSSNGSVTTGSNILYHTNCTTEPSSLVQFSNFSAVAEDSWYFRVDDLLSFAVDQSTGAKNQQRWYYMTTTVKLNTTILQETAQAFTDSLTLVSGVRGLFYAVTFQPLPTGLLQASEAQGGNSLGLSSKDGPLVIVRLLAHWENADDDHTIILAGSRLITIVNAVAQAQGQASSFRFMNYAYQGEDVIEGYGFEAVENLRAASKKYDPEGFFQTGVPGGFKLFSNSSY